MKSRVKVSTFIFFWWRKFPHLLGKTFFFLYLHSSENIFIFVFFSFFSSWLVYIKLKKKSIFFFTWGRRYRRDDVTQLKFCILVICYNIRLNKYFSFLIMCKLAIFNYDTHKNITKLNFWLVCFSLVWWVISEIFSLGAIK